MSSNLRSRSIDAMSAALAGFVLVAAVGTLFAQTAPQAAPSQQPDTFTGITVNLSPGAGENVSFHILRWSPEVDRNRLAAAFKEKGDAGCRRLSGRRRRSGSPGRVKVWVLLRYAHRVALPDGERAHHHRDGAAVGRLVARESVESSRESRRRRRRTTRSP